MLSESKGQQGKHGARESTSLSHDTVKLLKTQDAGYLRTVGERIRREMGRLEKEVRLQDGMDKILGEDGSPSLDDEDEDDDDIIFGTGGNGRGNKKRKLIFADSREDQKKIGGQIDQVDDNGDNDEAEDEEDDSLQTQLQKQPTKKQIEAQRQAHFRKLHAKRLKRRAAEGRRKKLEALRKQYTEITAAERELDLQRGRMSNSIGGVNKNGVKWKVKERKR